MRRLAAVLVFLAACGGNESRPVQPGLPTLTLASPQAGGEFGRAAACVGDLVAVGAPDRNRVHVYLGASGRLLRTLHGSGRFGAALAANGNELFVGAPQDGRVDVYDAVTGERLRILRSGGGDAFGAAVAVSGAEVWVGAPTRHSGAGEVVRFA